MTTWKIHTEAASRSKTKRSMNHMIIAVSREDAEYEARKRHVERVGWNASVWISSTEKVSE